MLAKRGSPRKDAKNGRSIERSRWLKARNVCCHLRFFYFFIFYFHFLQKYIIVFKIYRNIPRPPRVALLRGGRKFLQKSPWRTGRPTAGRPARGRQKSPWRTGRPAAGRPPPRYRRPSFDSPKIQKKILGLS